MNSPAMKIVIGVAVIAVIVLGCVFSGDIMFQFGRMPGVGTAFKPTVEAQIEKYGPAARARLEPLFKTQGLKYPPEKVSLIAIKDTKELQVYTANADSSYQYVCTYPILAASGHLGPKMVVGDQQVPEGLYVVTPEPNTAYHLALRLNYPNEGDAARAKEGGRDPGSDILIQGGKSSDGSLAMGDQAIEDLFILACDAADKAVALTITPVDFRTQPPPQANPTDPPWLAVVYEQIGSNLFNYPNPNTW